MKLAATLACSAALALIAGCDNSTGQMSNAGPPTIVCGTVLTAAAMGGVILDATQGPIPVVDATSAENLIFVRIAPGCKHGAGVQIAPTTAGRVVRSAPAEDGLPAAVAVEPHGDTAFHILGSGPAAFDISVALTR